MRSFRGLAILVVTLLGGVGACDAKPPVAVTPPPPPDAATCETATAALEAHLKSLPTTCTATPECMARYVRVNACIPVVVSSSWNPDADGRLRALQDSVRASCPLTTACEAVAATPACKLGVCVDDRGASGVAKRECAPNDGPAWTFTFTDGRQAMCDGSSFPNVTATVWASPELGKSYSLEGSTGVVMRCQTASSCSTGRGTVTVHALSAESVDVTVDATFPEGAVKERFVASVCPGQPLCG